MERSYRIALLAAALTLVVLQLQWAHSIAWDEAEFFRATKWTAEGRVPFRDFWEHHAPLQWLLFAPVAAFVDSPGTAAILVMRWAQLPLWIALFVILIRMTRKAGIDRDAAALAPVVLLASPLFVLSAIEYRLDLPAELAYIAAIAIVLARPQWSAGWVLFGALMSVAALTNLRLVYLIAPTAVLLAFVDPVAARWRWNARSLWMSAGIAAVAALFVAWLALTNALDEFLEIMRLNVVIDRLIAEEAETLVPLLLRPFTTYDVPAIAIFFAGLAAAALALRDIRRPGFAQILALLALLSLLSLARLGVHYPYHLQISMLLFAPLVATLLRAPLVRRFTMGATAVAIAVQLALLTRAETGEAMRYQDPVMREADRRTLPNEKVWDGAGFALRREPAYRYWFLPSVVRVGADQKLIPNYDAADMQNAPPAAILHTIRIHYWLKQRPAAAAYATRHYVPLYRDLWIPALSTKIGRGQRAEWIAPRGGRFRLIASDVLAKHPWFLDPVNYPLLKRMEDVAFDVELARLPPADRRGLRLIVDGRVVDEPVFELKKGSFVILDSALPQPAGVLIVPDDVEKVFIAPDAEVMM